MVAPQSTQKHTHTNCNQQFQIRVGRDLISTLPRTGDGERLVDSGVEGSDSEDAVLRPDLVLQQKHANTCYTGRVQHELTD